jgi:hypothetical protein
MFNSNSPATSSGMSRLSDSFSEHGPFIEKTDFKNRKRTIHDNLGESLFLENIVEHQVTVYSADRGNTLPTYTSFSSRYVQPYYNPFNFVVTFNGTTSPKIQYKMENVKYIRLDDLILPKTNVINMAPGDPAICTMSTVASDQLSNQRGLVLNIHELKTPRVHSTGTVIGEDGFIMYLDQLMGTEHCFWKATHTLRTFPKSCLGNITKLTLDLYNQNNSELNVVTDQGDTLNMIQTIQTGFYMYAGVQTALPAPDIITLQSTYNTLQSIYEFTFGLVENELNTLTNYAHA